MPEKVFSVHLFFSVWQFLSTRFQTLSMLCSYMNTHIYKDFLFFLTSTSFPHFDEYIEKYIIFTYTNDGTRQNFIAMHWLTNLLIHIFYPKLIRGLCARIFFRGNFEEFFRSTSQLRETKSFYINNPTTSCLYYRDVSKVQCTPTLFAKKKSFYEFVSINLWQWFSTTTFEVRELIKS